MNQSDAFTIVADPDRRRIIRALAENGGRATVEDLSRRISSGRRAAAGDVHGRRRTEIGLIHNHLPRLQDHGVIEYDLQSGDVELGDTAELDPYLVSASL